MAEGISDAGSDTEEKDFYVFVGILTHLARCDMHRISTQLLEKQNLRKSLKYWEAPNDHLFLKHPNQLTR